MRLFVALDIPEETREALSGLLRRFSNVRRGARWVRSESIHITLKFIGDAEESSLPAIKDSLRQVNSGEGIEIVFRHFGFFPNERHPRVFWVGMEAGPALAGLASEIDARLQPLGISHEERGFRPHLTLARFNSTEGLPKLREMIEGLASREFGRTTAQEFHLYQSTLKRGEAEYTRLATYPFARGSE